MTQYLKYKNIENEKKLKELIDKVESYDFNNTKLNEIDEKVMKIENEICLMKEEKVKENDNNNKEEESKDNNSSNILKDKESEIKVIIERLNVLEEKKEEIEKITNENEQDIENISKIGGIIKKVKKLEEKVNKNKDLIVEIGCIQTIDKIITNIVEEIDINNLIGRGGEEEEEEEYVAIEDDKYHKGYNKENDNYYYFNRKTGDTTFDVPDEWKDKSNIKIGDIIEDGKYIVRVTSDGELYKKNIESGECKML